MEEGSTMDPLKEAMIQKEAERQAQQLAKKRSKANKRGRKGSHLSPRKMSNGTLGFGILVGARILLKSIDITLFIVLKLSPPPDGSWPGCRDVHGATTGDLGRK